MRLAFLSPLMWRTPPRHYGPRERLASLLCEGLVARGIEVTLFATGDSNTQGQLTAVCPPPADDPQDARTWHWEAAHMSHVGTRMREFDLIHNFGNVLPLMYSHMTRIPMLTTIFDTPSSEQLPIYQNRYVVAPSAASQNPHLNYLTTIYPGVDLSVFPSSEAIGTYLVFCGRMHPDEEVTTAIEIARRYARPLVLVGPTMDPAYFETQIAPCLDPEYVTYVGAVEAVTCRNLLAGAYALLLPSQKPKPFSLSAVEAMACGTPVVAWKAGAMSEIVRDGETGYVVTDIAEAVAKLNDVTSLDRRRCRQWVTERFSQDRMVSEYVELYREILEREKPHAPHAAPPWGQWEVLVDEATYKVKRITVLPDKRLSYQKHFKREEHWTIVQGRALVTLDGQELVLAAGETINIPLESAHRIANPGPDELVFIEVQRGRYFGEDDIIRLQDDFGRADA